METKRKKDLFVRIPNKNRTFVPELHIIGKLEIYYEEEATHRPVAAHHHRHRTGHPVRQHPALRPDPSVRHVQRHFQRIPQFLHTAYHRGTGDGCHSRHRQRSGKTATAHGTDSLRGNPVLRLPLLLHRSRTLSAPDRDGRTAGRGQRGAGHSTLLLGSHSAADERDDRTGACLHLGLRTGAAEEQCAEGRGARLPGHHCSPSTSSASS